MKNHKLAHHIVTPVGDVFANSGSTRRTEITIETHEIKTIRMRTVGGSTFCETCGEIATSYGLEHVAMFLQISSDEVSRSIGSGQIHLTRTEGPQDICGHSLKYMIRNSDA